MNTLVNQSCALPDAFLRLTVFRPGVLRLLASALLAAIAFHTSAQTTVHLPAGWTLLGNSAHASLDVATVFGDQANVNTVWKWIAPKSGWAFYTPTLTDGGAAYASSKGYDLLASVDAGEGFWVNAKLPFAAELPAGTVVQSASFQDITAGWNLISIGDNKTPAQFNNALSPVPPSPGVIANNLLSLWTWDPVQTNWYFYAPSLDAQGTLASYITSKGYLNFENMTLGPTMGFWVNAYPNETGTTTAVRTTTTSATTTTTVVTTTTTTAGAGATPAAAAPAVAVPTGAAPITITAATPAATFAALAPVVPAVAVSISSPPRVAFSLTDGAGNAIIGFGSTSRSATATVASYPNLAFSIAKLVPGTNGAPSRWVSYIVTSVPTTAAAATAQRPGTDNTGTLVDNKDGTYIYTFYRDITKVKSEVAAMTLTAPNVAADLGDLTYDPNALHRLTIQIAGNAPGTGTNTPDGVQTVAGVPLTNPVNAIYDFIPATGKAVAATDSTVKQRNIVDKASCNECHGKLGGIPGTGSAGFHGGSRDDPRYCVVCHTDQRKYGRAGVVSSANAFPALTAVASSSGAVTYTPTTYVADGVTIGDFPALIHRVHMGEGLVKKNYNYANILLNETRFPQDIRNCTKCHDTAAPKVAPQGDNWKLVPSRVGCGACHDGIDWATGKGTTNADARQGLTTSTYGHVGGAQSSDANCALCHARADINVYHTPVTPPNPANALLAGGSNGNTNAAWIASNSGNLPAGAIKVSYEISSVSRNASRNPVMVFRMLQNGVAVPFNDRATKTEIWDNFMGAPGVYFVFAVPQDGIAAPADFNAAASSYLRSLWNGTAAGNAAGTLTGPDAGGYYTATLTGVGIPDSAVMLTGGLGYSYNVLNALPLTQTNLADYPVSAATTTAALTAGMPNRTGGLIVVAPNVQKVATGYTGRRAIVSDALCNQCHQELGMSTRNAFHAGQRNDATTCSWCHTPNRTSSGWSADSSSYVHAIHAGAKRMTPFTWHAASTADGLWKIGYPGILKNCEACHLAGTYDFSAPASASALANKQYRTVGQGRYDGTVAGSLAAFSISPYVTADNVMNYGAGFVFNASLTTASNITKADGTVFSNPAQGSFSAEGSTLVISPIATTCFSCHDSTLARQHMESNGGSIYKDRASSLAKGEQCMLCHGTGKIVDIKVIHAK